jgi:hypothetical protein
VFVARVDRAGSARGRRIELAFDTRLRVFDVETGSTITG